MNQDDTKKCVNTTSCCKLIMNVIAFVVMYEGSFEEKTSVVWLVVNTSSAWELSAPYIQN